MAKPLRPFVRGGGYYPSKKWIPLVRNGGYTTQNGGETEPVWATASGAIASFTTPLAYPLKKLMAEINPVQDLHGQDAPYPPEGKGNLYPFQDKTTTSNGVTAVFSGNHIKATGTGTASGGRLNLVSANFALKAGTYYYKRFNISLGGQQQTALYVQNGIDIISPINDGTFTLSEDSSTINLGMNVESGKTYNCEFDIMLVSGSTEPSAFYPYSNICPISGWTGLSGQRTGANLFDKTTITDNAYVNGAGVVISNTEFFCSDYISVKPETSYYIYTDINGRMDTIRFYDANKAVIGGSAYQKRVVTTPANCHYIRINAIKSHVSADEVFFNYPSTDTSYHAYTGEPISVSFGTTVYGGTDEVVGGNGTSTMGMVDFSDLSWSLASATYGRWYAVIGGIKPPADGATPLNAIAEEYKIVTSNAYNNVVGTMYGVPNGTTINVCNGSATDKPKGKLVYELATPTTFTHEGQPVDTLVGQNNVWVTSGDVEVTYRIE